MTTIDLARLAENGAAGLSFLQTGLLQPALNGAQGGGPATVTAAPDDTPARRFRFLRRAEWQALPVKEWLLTGLFGPGDLVMLHAPSGSGKTFAVIDLAAHCSLGLPWAGGAFQVARPLRILYLCGEGMTGIPQRLRSLEETIGRPLDNLTIGEVPQLFNAAAFDGVAAFLSDWRADCAARGEDAALDLLVVDTLHSASYGADENSAQDAGRVLQSLKALGKAAGGAAVMVTHHTNVAGTRERGSSALRGAMDCVCSIDGTGLVRTLHCDKLKDGAPWPDRRFSLEPCGGSATVSWLDGAYVVEAKGKEQSDRAALLAFLRAHPGREYRAAELAATIGKSQKQTDNLLKSLWNAGATFRRMDTTRTPRACAVYSAAQSDAQPVQSPLTEPG